MDPEQREAVAGVWALGDYAQVAARLAPAAQALAERLGDGHGRRALDVATGTGSVARALASRGWAVSASDLCAPLLGVASRTARSDGLVIDWREGSLEDAPFADETFAATTSSFGLISRPTRTRPSPSCAAACARVARSPSPRGPRAATWAR